MAIYHGGAVAAEVCKAVGIDPKYVQKLIITLDMNSAATIEVYGFANIQDVTTVADVFRKFELTPSSKTFCLHELMEKKS